MDFFALLIACKLYLFKLQFSEWQVYFSMSKISLLNIYNELLKGLRGRKKKQKTDGKFKWTPATGIYIQFFRHILIIDINIHFADETIHHNKILDVKHQQTSCKKNFYGTGWVSPEWLPFCLNGSIVCLSFHVWLRVQSRPRLVKTLGEHSIE